MRSESIAVEPFGLLGAGLVHAFANSLFALQSQARALPGAPAQALLRACEHAQTTLEILRFSLDGACGPRPVQAGVLLHRLTEILRISLRDLGLGIAYEHASNETPALVDGRVLCRAVTSFVARLAHALPGGSAGRIVVDLARQTQSEALVIVRVESASGFLPFTPPIVECVVAVQDNVCELGATIAADEPAHAARITLPAWREPAGGAG